MESIQHSASEGGEEDTPTESVSLAFAKDRLRVPGAAPAAGRYGEWIKFSWDQAFNKE